MGVLGLLSGSRVVVLESQLHLGGRDTLGLPNGSRVLLPACRKIGMGSWVVVLESQLRLGGRDTLRVPIGSRVLQSGSRVSSARSSTSSRGRDPLRVLMPYTGPRCVPSLFRWIVVEMDSPALLLPARRKHNRGPAPHGAEW